MNRRYLGNLLGAVALAISDRIDRATTDIAGMTGGAAAALLTIGTRPGLTIDALSRTLALSHSGTVRLVDRLHERGWVTRDRHRAGREVHLTLSRRGSKLFEELLDARRSVLNETIAAMPDRHLADFQRALVAMLESLPQDREEARNICRLCEHRICRGPACPVGTAAGRLEAQ